MIRVRTLIAIAFLAATAWLLPTDHARPIIRRATPEAISAISAPATATEPAHVEIPRYAATIDADGLAFEAEGVRFDIGLISATQGDRVVLAGDDDRVIDASETTKRIARGPIVEEYVYEPSRMEQLFHLDAPLGAGELRLRLSAKTNLDGPVVEIPKNAPGWQGAELWNGGLKFCDAQGEARLLYHSAVAIDADGRRQALEPHYVDGEIRLDVPADFMASAIYPLTIDPWVELAGSATGSGVFAIVPPISRPALCVTPAGDPVVAAPVTLAGPGTASRICVKVWNGTAWTGFGGSDTIGISAGTSSASWVSMTLDAQGFPYVAWAGTTPGLQYAQVFLRRWNGATWVAVGNSDTGLAFFTPGRVGITPCVKLDPSGSPAVAWQCCTYPLGGTTDVYFRLWTGTSWQELSGSATGAGISQVPGGITSVPSLSMAHGIPAVAWGQYIPSPPYGLHVYMRFWYGSWQELAGSASGGGISQGEQISSGCTLIVDSSFVPYVAYEAGGIQQGIRLRRLWNGAWSGVGGSEAGQGIGNPNGGVAFTLVDFGGGTSVPVIAWGDHLLDIQMKFWLPGDAAWSELGGSATGGGVSATPHWSGMPAVAVDPLLRPIVAWNEEPWGQGARIHLRRCQ